MSSRSLQVEHSLDAFDAAALRLSVVPRECEALKQRICKRYTDVMHALEASNTATQQQGIKTL
jgi:hypothetical protein